MSKKLPDLSGSAGLGDLDFILHNQSVSDLSWLSVDEADYRAAEALPKQNLDIIPELVHALREDDDIPHVIPLKPHTIVNRNPLENSGQTSAVDMTAPIRNRVAAMVMAGLSIPEIEKKIHLQFAPGDIRIAASAIRDILSERGLLGNVYVDAAHFPNAHRDPKEKKFVAAFAKNAIFVIGGCGGKNGCNCHQTGLCSTFGSKRVVDEVPYTAKLANSYASRLAAENRPIRYPTGRVDELPVSGREWKEIIRSSFLKSPISKNPDGLKIVRTQHQAAKPVVSTSDIESFWERRFATPSTPGLPSIAYMKYARRMMKGHNDSQILTASGSSELIRLASQFGIIGHTYIDIDALGGCRNAVDLLQSRAASNVSSISPDYIVRRSASCSYCHDVLDGACAQLCRVSKLIHDIPVIGRTELATALQRAVLQKRIKPEQARSAFEKTSGSLSTNWQYLVGQVNFYQPREASKDQYTGHKQTAFNGASGSELSKAEMDPEEVRKTISHLMNTGLSGKALQAAILQRYSRDDLKQVPEVGRRASMDDGIQGHYFIDPTAYRDYGRGCDDGAKHFRKRGAQYVLASSSCTGCVLQTHPGWCSKFAKGMIRQVPTQVRDRVASARRVLPVVQDPVENPVDRYELAGEISVDMSGSKSRGISIEISGPSLDE